MITLRKATLKDLNNVHEIETLSFNDGSYPLFVLRQLFDISNDYFLVAVEDHKILGYALGNILNTSHQGWILSLGVHPESRGKKIGKMLTSELIKRLECNNCQTISLTVHPDNAAAIKIYQNLNFEIVEESNNYYLDGESRLLMKTKPNK